MTDEAFEEVYGLLKEGRVVFWDFDGVIKDSVLVKSKGYEKLFLPFGKEVVDRVNQHHENNGGVSRYEKIHYIWVGRVNPLIPIRFRIFVTDFQN